MFQSSLFKFNRELYNKRKYEQPQIQNETLIDYSIPVIMQDDSNHHQQPQHDSDDSNSSTSFWNSSNVKNFGLSSDAFTLLSNNSNKTQSSTTRSKLVDSPSSTMPMNMIQDRVDSNLPKHYSNSIHIELDHTAPPPTNEQMQHNMEDHYRPSFAPLHVQHHHHNNQSSNSNSRFVSQEEFFQQVYQRYQTSDSTFLSNGNNNSPNNSGDQEVATSIFTSFSFWC